MAAACCPQAFLKAASVTNEALMILPNALYMVEAPQDLVHAQYNKYWAQVADSLYHFPVNDISVAELSLQP